MMPELSKSWEPGDRPAGEARSTWLDGWARGQVRRALASLDMGRIVLRDGRSADGFGPADAPLRAVVTVLAPAFYRRVVLGGTLGAGEAYMEGLWRCDDLTALMRILIRAETVFAELNRGVARLAAPLRWLGHALRRNTRAGSRRNIHAHYDLSNDFYRLWLDETLTYSGGVFERPEATLAEASVAKLDRICRKLQLRPLDHVLEIGTGWGSFALHAAGHYGCRVTTTTISEAQYALAAERIAAAGLQERITLLRSDYRDLRGRYDKLVSIEMIEAVGHQYYETFFRHCAHLLKPGGAALLQFINMADRYYAVNRHRVDFIKKHIFPGSCIPSLGALLQAATRGGDLQVWHVEDLTPHYARTLRCWYDRFRTRLEAVRALGYSEAFIRRWEFYLCYCEAGFHERSIGSMQLLLLRPGCTVTPVLAQNTHLRGVWDGRAETEIVAG